jgi:hypothetical protein
MVNDVSETEHIAHSNITDVFQIEKNRVCLFNRRLRVQELFCNFEIAIFEVLDGFQKVHHTAYGRFAIKILG